MLTTTDGAAVIRMPTLPSFQPEKPQSEFGTLQAKRKKYLFVFCKFPKNKKTNQRIDCLVTIKNKAH